MLYIYNILDNLLLMYALQSVTLLVCLLLLCFLVLPIGMKLLDGRVLLALSISPFVLYAFIYAFSGAVNFLDETIGLDVASNIDTFFALFLFSTILSWFVFWPEAIQLKGLSTLIAQANEKFFVFLFFTCALLGFLIFFPNVSLHFIPPQDNDAIIHAFIIQNLRELPTDQILNCEFNNDIVRTSAGSYYPCSAHLLGALGSVILDISSIQILNSMYVFGAVFLGIGAFTFAYEKFSNTKIGLVLTCSIFSFLVFPYAVNGIFTFFLSLVFLLPLIATLDYLLSEMGNRKRAWTIIVFLLISSINFHPSLTFILVSYILVQKLFDNQRTNKELRNIFALLISAVIVFVILVQMKPSSFESIKGNATYQALFVFGNVKIENPVGVTPNEVIRNLLLGSPWTFALPVLFLLYLYGLSLIFKDTAYRRFRPLAVMSILFYVLWLMVMFQAQLGAALAFMFYGNWYRVISVFSILASPIIAIAVAHALKLDKDVKT